MNILLLLLCISFAKDSLEHGAHVYPYPWHVSNWDDCKVRDPETMNPYWINFENMLPNPHRFNPFTDIEICEYPEGCEFHMGRYEWGSAGVTVKEITQVEEMYDDKMYVGERAKHTKYNPWSAPGHAYAPCNDGCGINGLNPGGCENQAFENLEDYCPNVDITKLLYGKCCPGGSECAHYEGGVSAMRFWGNGDYTFDNTPITKWTQGEPALVEWMISADHRGGYAYRLCKVPEDGISGIKEDCFENGHLNFAKTPMSSVFHLPKGEKLNWDKENGSWIERPITTTRIGTKPDNSEWAKIDLPGLYKMVDGKMIDVPRSDYSDKIPKNGDYKFKWECDDECQKKMEDDGVKDGLHGKWAFKDYVEIPADRFAPGKYVLSFRWDSQRKDQIWNSCATVEIVTK